jgi:hypothetical protein
VAPEHMTMESLREALADYLNQVVTEMGALGDDMLGFEPDPNLPKN